MVAELKKKKKENLFSVLINHPNIQFIQNTELGTQLGHWKRRNYIAFINSFFEYAN